MDCVQVPGAAAVIAAQEAVLAQERALAAPLVPQVPGLAEHAAAEAQGRQHYTVKKRLSFFPSPAGMSLTKLSLAGNNFKIPVQGKFG